MSSIFSVVKTGAVVALLATVQACTQNSSSTTDVLLTSADERGFAVVRQARDETGSGKKSRQCRKNFETNVYNTRMATRMVKGTGITLSFG